MRPANIITAHADIAAGYAAAGVTQPVHLAQLLIATTGLYGGGVVFNDVFDAKLSSIERPERPIPSGIVSLSDASWLGGLLLTGGVTAPYSVLRLAAWLRLLPQAQRCFTIRPGKHHSVLGPINMGLCRGLNLLLGLSAAGTLPVSHMPLALITLCYIAGITSLSRGEVSGGTQTAAAISATWLALALVVLVLLISLEGRYALYAAPFFVLLLYRIGGPFWRAFHSLGAQDIRSAVKAGVLSLIVLDAGLAALFGGPVFGVAVLLLYIPALALAKFFAVT